MSTEHGYEPSPLEMLSESDRKVAQEQTQKLEALRALQPTGDIVKDVSELLRISGRDAMYQLPTKDQEPEVVLAGLSGLRNAWSKVKKDPSTFDMTNLAKKLFYIDVPDAEVEAANRIINFYLNSLSRKS